MIVENRLMGGRVQIGAKLPGYQKRVLGWGYHVVGKGGVFVDGQASTKRGGRRGERETAKGQVGGWSKLVYRALTRRQSPQDASMGQSGWSSWWYTCLTAEVPPTAVVWSRPACVCVRAPAGEGGTYVCCCGCDVNQYVICTAASTSKKAACQGVTRKGKGEIGVWK